MGFIPGNFFTRAPARIGPDAPPDSTSSHAPEPVHAPDPAHPHGCVFCARRFPEMYLLPNFGLADLNEVEMIACGECYAQVTFTSPRASARVVLLDRRP
jgi:hypothetical protein